MNNLDLSTMIGDVKLNIRVGAILEYNGKILIEKNKALDYCVLPGGRIHTLESTEEALIRELKEELGIDISKEKITMFSIIENFFVKENKKYHELYYLYKVELDKNYNIKDGFENIDNNDSDFYWYTREKFKDNNILPSILKDIIDNKEFKNYMVKDIK